MANNELFYLAARVALAGDYADTSISGLIIDLGTAVEKHLQQLEEQVREGTYDADRLAEEIRHGVIHAARLLGDLKAWQAITYEP